MEKPAQPASFFPFEHYPWNTHFSDATVETPASSSPSPDSPAAPGASATSISSHTSHSGPYHSHPHPIVSDETVARLERAIVSPQSKPDQRRRWTVQVIERMRVAERACALLFGPSPLNSELGEIWHDAQHEAIRQLRAEGKIR